MLTSVVSLPFIMQLLETVLNAFVFLLMLVSLQRVFMNSPNKLLSDELVVDALWSVLIPG